MHDEMLRTIIAGITPEILTNLYKDAYFNGIPRHNRDTFGNFIAVNVRLGSVVVVFQSENRFLYNTISHTITVYPCDKFGVINGAGKPLVSDLVTNVSPVFWKELDELSKPTWWEKICFYTAAINPFGPSLL